MFYTLKMITIKEIREFFREMLQDHETKQKGMFTKHEISVFKADAWRTMWQVLLQWKQTSKSLKKALVSPKTI